MQVTNTWQNKGVHSSTPLLVVLLYIVVTICLLIG